MDRISRIRGSAKKSIHSNFGLSGYYADSAIGLFVTVKARLYEDQDHLEPNLITDGYSQYPERPNYLRFNDSEVTPSEGATFTLADSGTEYQIVRVLPSRKGYTDCEAIRQ